MQKINFEKNKWSNAEMLQAYSFRFTETPDFHQAEDHIYTDVNPEHREGYDNISMLTKEKYTAGVTATIHCSFEGWGCPEIIIVEQTEKCDDGAVRYGACFETVLYKDGVNVWRHYRNDGVCSWHKRLALYTPFAENEIHTLKVTVNKDYIDFDVDGIKTSVRTEDLPQQFHIGFTACEGIVRIYDFEVEL